MTAMEARRIAHVIKFPEKIAMDSPSEPPMMTDKINVNATIKPIVKLINVTNAKRFSTILDRVFKLSPPQSKISSSIS